MPPARPGSSTRSVGSTSGYSPTADQNSAVDTGRSKSPARTGTAPEASDERFSSLPVLQQPKSSSPTSRTAEQSTHHQRPRAPFPGGKASPITLPAPVASVSNLSNAAAIELQANADVIELQAMPAESPPRLSMDEMRTILGALPKLNRSLAASIDETTKLHGKIIKELARSNVTALTDEQLQKIDEIQQFIATAGPIKTMLEEFVSDLAALSAPAHAEEEPEPAGKNSRIQRGIGLAEVLLSIVAKNVAWYAFPAAIPSKHVSFNDIGAMTGLVAARSNLALLAAAVTEYPLATDGQRRYKNAGGKLNVLQGYAQAFDQLVALGVLFATNAATGQATPPGYQIVGFGLSALGAAVQTGALNGVILRVVRPISQKLYSRARRPVGARFVPIDTADLRARRALAMEPADVDLEQGLGPIPLGKRTKTGLDSLLDRLPAQKLETMKNEVLGVCNSMSQLHQAIFQPTQETIAVDVSPVVPPTQETIAANVSPVIPSTRETITVNVSPVISSTRETITVNVSPVIPPTRETIAVNVSPAISPTQEAIDVDASPSIPSEEYDVQIERFKRDLGAIQASAIQYRDGLAPDDARRARIDEALKLAREVDNDIDEMPQKSTLKKTAFFAAMATLSVTGAILGAIGPSINDAWLSDINHRAAIFGVTSSVLQAFANLGQFLGGAEPGDGRLMRILKIGMDDENNPYKAWTKNWLRSVRFLLGEFPLLELSTTFSEMAHQEAGKIPQAPMYAMPSAYTTRNVQEAFRAAFSLAFTTIVLEEEAHWNNFLGLGISTLGGLVPVLIERSQAIRVI